MLIWIFRGIFLIVIVAVLFTYVNNQAGRDPEAVDTNFSALVLSGLGMAILAFLLDVLTPKNKLNALAGVFFGLLVGLLVSSALADVVDMVNESWGIGLESEVVIAIRTMMGICICYLAISLVMRTKDDVRFVIPYVEFAKQTKGARPLILDTSAIVDGRIADLCKCKLFDSPILVPRFVLNELQLIADSADKLKRNRGRRGLDILNKMQSDPAIDIDIDDTSIAEVEELKGVDQKIVSFTKLNDGRVATTDYNLSKVAQVRGVDVLNINDLASMLKVVALPGELMHIKIIKPGEESDQGIGYLEDGTMVVVEGARNKIGREIAISVTSSLQTSAGKMIFGKFEDLGDRSNATHTRPVGNRRRHSPARRSFKSSTRGSEQGGQS